MLNPSLSKKVVHFCKDVGRGINRFQMIRDNDRVLIAVSGGKDSLALSYALQERKKWIPIRYEFLAIHIDWREFPITQVHLDALIQFFKILGIPFRSIRASIFPPSFRGNFNCYLCSRNRKRILFTEAERMGYNKVALGHNLDDVVETTLINLLFRGQFSTMMPVHDFFDGRLTIIRPMMEVRERNVTRISKLLEFPIVPIACPNAHTNQRLLIKEVIHGLSRINKRVRENIYRSPWHINWEYLPHLLEPPKEHKYITPERQ